MHLNFLKKIFSLKGYVILFCILLLSILLRTMALGSIPSILQNDEIANTYGARFILLHGIDLYANSFPLLYLDKFGDFPPVLPMYLSGLGTFLFGNNEFGARILIALFGASIVIPAFSIGLSIFKNRKTALFIALLFAIFPGHIVLSRFNAEAVVALTVYMTAIALLFSTNILKSKSSYMAITASFLLFLLTYFLYPSYRILIPLTAIGIVFYKYIQLRKFSKIYLFIVFMMISIFLTLTISSTDWGKGRFDQTSIFSPVSGVSQKIQTLVFNEDSIFVARMFNNKVIGFGREFLTQYSQYFSLNYLFGEAGRPSMYNIPYMGLLLLSIVPLIFISIFKPIQALNKNISYPSFMFLMFLLLISPIPAALTVIDVPSAQRALMTPTLILFIAGYGFNALLQIKKYRIIIFSMIIILIIGEVVFFLHQYFQNFNYYTANWRNDGNKQVVEYIQKNHHKYDKVFVTSEEAWLPAYYLFYFNIYDKNMAGKFKQNFRVPQIDNIYFTEISCPGSEVLSFVDSSESIVNKVLIIDSINCPQYKQGVDRLLQKVTTIKRLNEMDIFTIYEADFNEKGINLN
ncbi:hypothetical protein COY16_03230 [Candidatus Roizmanbacteria bacterium CG_4_10_14_0_2_um_filter_39_13]|uniref:Glycosyltransferase RgtA/B/C/D-like domain-containing protein n=1 Tax=Candidatus Roizmanbacteria bacterium CG_4_10_14_0_2_um_filter_39_13 TaxID=1974825 RepID=A0A2M7TYN3_9BACT|nr:MAG: hypothetical protein COY16_03230 [Candidatus Roizmanbacteria bacterium CG_4_10_14_0_2_um_filter_39_13]